MRKDGQDASAPLDGLRPAQSPRDQLSGTVGWSRDGAALSGTIRYVSAQFDDDQNGRTLAPATTLDARAAVPLTRALSIDLRVENVANARVEAGTSGAGIVERAIQVTWRSVEAYVADGARAEFVGLLAAVPFLAAVFASWQVVLGVGALATIVGAVFVGADGRLDVTGMVNVLGIVLSTGIAAAVATIRQRQAARIAELLRLAAVAQQAVLRPLGPQVGSLAVAGRYISATAAADIGGDLYEALDTPYGVRIIIGDVRGKGLDAVRLASIVLGSYRHVAYERADLRAIVTDLDRAVARSVGDEDFVTAALVEERGGTLTIVNCGHPAPLLLRRGQVIALEPPAPAPPLGFMPVARPRVERLACCCSPTAWARRAGTGSSSRPRTGRGVCSATVRSVTGWPRWSPRWSTGYTAGWTTTSPWSCSSTPDRTTAPPCRCQAGKWARPAVKPGPVERPRRRGRAEWGPAGPGSAAPVPIRSGGAVPRNDVAVGSGAAPGSGF